MNFDLAKIVKRLVPIILIGIIGNIAFTIYTSEEKFLDSLGQFTPLLFFLAIFMSIIPWFGHALRTVIWAKFLNSPISFKNSLRIALAHELGGAITPTVVGGTPIKFGMLINNGVPAGSAGMIIVLQVTEDLVFLITSLPLSIYFAGGLTNPAVVNLMNSIATISLHLWWLLPTLIMAFILVRVVYKKQKNKSLEEERLTLIQKLRIKISSSWVEFIKAGGLILKSGKLRFLFTATLMYLEWSSRFAIPIVLAFALGIKADPFQLFFLHWIVWLTMLVTPTPGASGGAETVFYFLFLPFVPENLIGILITGWRFVSYYLMMLIGAVVLQAIGVVSIPSKSRSASNID